MSRYAQRTHGFSVNRLQRADATQATWQELLVADRRATPAELAVCRLDFAAWWSRRSRSQRRIAAALTAGSTTSETARAFRLTAGRISQLRRELEANWHKLRASARV